VVICATPIGGKNHFKALSETSKAAELVPAAPEPIGIYKRSERH
jgi:hypothetical protein